MGLWASVRKKSRPYGLTAIVGTIHVMALEFIPGIENTVGMEVPTIRSHCDRQVRPILAWACKKQTVITWLVPDGTLGEGGYLYADG